MTGTRGSWNLERAIVARWNAANLSVAFRSEGNDPDGAEYPVLYDGEPAASEPPGPYCVWTRLPPAILGHSSGASVTDEYQYQDQLIQFDVHARSKEGEESGKSIAQRLAILVADAFDPDQRLDLGGIDRHINTIRGPDWSTREGDDEWVWHLQFTINFDAAYAQRAGS